MDAEKPSFETQGGHVLFDVYIMVDWNSSSRLHPVLPSATAPWLASAVRGAQGELEIGTHYFRSRRALLDHLLQYLNEAVQADQRVLVGFDFPLGYPAGFSAALHAPHAEPPWLWTWNLLAHPEPLVHIPNPPANNYAVAGNANNRFDVGAYVNERLGVQPGPFYGCPMNMVGPWLAPDYRAPCAAGAPVAHYREVELRLIRQGYHPACCWRLWGQGSVGGQSLTGIPAVQEVLNAAGLIGGAGVWPFQVGFDPTPTQHASIVLVEIWPSLRSDLVAEVEGDYPEFVHDQAQVVALARWFAELDAQEVLGEKFGVPNGLAPAALESCQLEEGWILGV